MGWKDLLRQVEKIERLEVDAPSPKETPVDVAGTATNDEWEALAALTHRVRADFTGPADAPITDGEWDALQRVIDAAPGGLA